jgi:ubiquinol-cytochrome c reductase cytochrome c subunit
MRTSIAAALAAALATGSLAASGAAPSGDAAHGKALFMSEGCFACHGTVGHGEPYGPRLAPKPLVWEAFVHQLRHPRSSMPPYSPKYVNDKDLADIYAYLESIPAGPKASEIPLLKD